MLFNQLLKMIGLRIHISYNKAYTFWKTRESKVKFRIPLNYGERKFFIQLQPILTDNGLIVYDIGASIGILSSCLAKMPNLSQVHSFEPIPSIFKKLSEKMKPYPNIVCHNVALGDSNEKIKMHVMNNAPDASSILPMAELLKTEFHGCYDSHGEYVRMVKLDDFVLEKELPQPHVIKIDVQGYEDRVLRGGINTISKAKYCVLEISFAPLYEKGPLFDDIYQIMRKMGFILVGLGEVSKGKSGMPLQVDGIFKNESYHG